MRRGTIYYFKRKSTLYSGGEDESFRSRTQKTDDTANMRQVRHFYELLDRTAPRLPVVLNYSRKQSIEALEAQLHDRTLKMACLKFSGLPGFTAHEQVQITYAMTALIENSARTVIACVLEDVRESDAYHTIGEYFRNRNDLEEQKICNNPESMILVNKLHNLVTDPLQIIEFIDNRAPVADFRQLKKQQREEIRAEILARSPRPGFHPGEIGQQTMKTSLASAFGSSMQRGFNKDSWRNMLASTDSYNSDYDDFSEEELRKHQRDNKTLLGATWSGANVVAIDSDLLHFGYNASDRGYIIYQVLHNSMKDSQSYAADLYKYVLDAYNGVLPDNDILDSSEVVADADDEL